MQSLILDLNFWPQLWSIITHSLSFPVILYSACMQQPKMFIVIIIGYVDLAPSAPAVLSLITNCLLDKKLLYSHIVLISVVPLSYSMCAFLHDTQIYLSIFDRIKLCIYSCS